MKRIILDIIHLNNDYTGNGMFMALYLITLLFIIFVLNEKKLKNKIGYPAVLLLLFVYLGITSGNYILARSNSQFDNEIMGRFVWLFMIPAIAAIGCTFMVSALKSRKEQVLLTISLIPVLFMCGVFQINDYRFQKADNLYKLPQVFIDIADAVLSDQAKDDGMARMIVPYETAYSFRQYSSRVELLYGEDATFGRIWPIWDERRDACETMQTTCPDLDVILDTAEKFNGEYILFDCTYVDFGLKSINTDGYTVDENFVGDRTPDPGVLEKMKKDIVLLKDGDSGKPYWDLGGYGLEYMGRYERYLLYRFADFGK